MYNLELINLANQYLTFLKVDIITLEQFSTKMAVLLDVNDLNKNKDDRRFIRNILITKLENGRKWK